MKKKFACVVAAVAFLSATGCIGDYREKIDELNALADDLEAQCTLFNSNLDAYSKIIQAVHDNDMITGVADIRNEKDEVTGYTISFVNRPSVSVYNGKDGKLPYVTAEKDAGSTDYYWKIQYGTDGSSEWLLDEKGEKVLAIWKTPIFSIENDIWKYSLDGGKTWMELGAARGENADSMFKEVDVSDSLFVVFNMSDGSVLRVPRYETYSALCDSVFKVNDNIMAQKILLDAMLGEAAYVVSVEDRLVDGHKTGVSVTLSNGSSFVISDWVKSPVPFVLAEKDTVDGIYYWTCRFADEEAVWITDSDGRKIKAVASAPVVSIKEKAGNYYWYVASGEEGHFVLDTDGNEIAVSGKNAFAADSVQYRAFKSVVYDEDCLEILLNNVENTPIRLMRQFAVTLSSAHLEGGVLTIPEKQYEAVSFSATGAEVRDVVVIKEGEVTADVDMEKNSIYITKMTSEGGSVSLLFTLSEKNSTNTRFIRLKVE